MGYSMSKIMLLLSVLLIVTACASHTNKADLRRNATEAWKGIDELSLIQQVGPPDKVYEVEGHRFLEYYYMGESTLRNFRKNDSDYRFNGYLTDNYGMSVPKITQDKCKLVFEIEEGKVSHGRARGNACKKFIKQLLK